MKARTANRAVQAAFVYLSVITGTALHAKDCDIVVTNCSFIGNISSAFFAGIWDELHFVGEQ